MGRRGKLPPLTGSDFARMLALDGWYEVPGGSHRNWRHPTKRGKAQTSDKWTGVKPGHAAFKGLLAQTGWTKTDAIELYWKTRGL